MTKKEILQVTQNLHVLYVEDDKLMQETSQELFEIFFKSVSIVSDGVQALKLHKEKKFDMIITDISMPYMDGIEMMQHIRKDDLTIPIIVFSALNNPSSITACISLNVDAYLLKPMKTKNLLEALEKASLKLLSNSHKSPYELVSQLKENFDLDKLTGLKSHGSLLDAIEKTSEKETPVMILINIDSFHIYNEIYGLSTGDTILKKFAQQLKEFAKSSPYELYRMSGDEFVLFEVVEAIDPEVYMHDIQTLITYIETSPITLPNIKEAIHLAITVGISFDKNNSYGKADMALQEARRRGRQYLGYNVEADRRKELQNNLYWREEINRALDESRVHAYFQPIVDKNRNIIKYESLIRIQQIQPDGTCKLIAPEEFLDFSKISRQYIGLTTTMIEESFKTMREENVHISINLTFHDIANQEINKLLRKNIQKHHLEHKTNFDISSQVIFELLEHPTYKDYELFISFVNEFKALGVVITIDNFGLGFSDMSKIAALAPHYVKIDASLIKNIATDKHAYSLVNAIVKFTQELGIKTIAEHVTTEEIFVMAKKLQIDEYQGFLFGKPTNKIIRKVKNEKSLSEY